MLKGRSGFGRSWRNPLNIHLQEEKVENTFSKEGFAFSGGLGPSLFLLCCTEDAVVTNE